MEAADKPWLWQMSIEVASPGAGPLFSWEELAMVTLLPYGELLKGIGKAEGPSGCPKGDA